MQRKQGLRHTKTDSVRAKFINYEAEMKIKELSELRKKRGRREREKQERKGERAGGGKKEKGGREGRRREWKKIVQI